MNLRLVARDLATRLESKRFRYRDLEAPPAAESSAGGNDLDGDAATSAQNRLDHIAERSRLYVECRALVEALARVASGRYGVCESCERPIPEERLRVHPAADLCVACKTDRERRATRALRGRAWTPEPDDDVPINDTLSFPAAHDRGELRP